MDEVDELLQLLLEMQPAKKISYEQIFIDHFGFNPHTVDIDTLQMT